MKKILTFFAVLLLAVAAWAQNPKLTYQAVVRDNANMLVTNSTVDVTLSVLRTDNSLQYTQSFDNVPTNQNGLFTLFFGGESGWDNVNWIHSKIAVAITLPDRSVVKDTTEVNAVPLAISTINAGTTGPSTQVQSDWAQTDQYAPSFIQNKPEIGDSVNTILVNGQYVTITMMDGRHYLTSDSAVIVNMQNNISNNIANIATNTTNISNNTTNIATNTANISNNTANIATNTANIAANTTNISNNTTNISNNTTNIATNTTNITANTTNISNNTTNIATNTANIAANTTNISNNTTNIAANTTNINNLILHTKKAAIRDSVAGQIHDSIAAIGATITQNHTHANMSVLNATTAPFTTANKTTLDSLAAAGAEQNVQANWNETNAANDAFIRNKPSITDTVNTILANRNFVTNTIMDGRHYLTSDSIVIVNMRNNISNNTTNIISNTTNIEANTTNINNNTTKIETNITNIAANTTNISNNTTNITNNTANIATNTTNISNNTTNIANNTANIATNTTNISNNTANIATNRTNIATNTTNINNNTANIATNTTNINNLILRTKKAAIRDSVAGQIHDSIAANNLVTINNNQTISGDKTFTGTTIVPSGFSFGTTTAGTCNNVAVNACDLLAVFDSIQRRMDNLESVIEGLHNEVANLRDTVRILRGDSVPTVTVSLPTVTTSSATNITETTATCGGNVTADGGADVTARGVCWGTGANPTIGGSHTTDGTGTGSFTSTITGLTAGTTYHVRAYATNSEGTAYGEDVSFTTQNTTPVTPVDGQPCPGAATVTDIDNHIYHTVQIGEQCWMKENLKTTRYADGTSISLGVDYSEYSTTTAYRYCPDFIIDFVKDYGYLYNWPAVMHNSLSSNLNPSGVQGVCPDGWHVPSKAEWTQMKNYVSDHSQNVEFKAIPAGYNKGRYYDYFRERAYYWSTTKNSCYVIYNNNPEVLESSLTEDYGCSVRCLRDEAGGSTASLPTVTTSSATNITETSATCGGNVTADGGASVTARGVCWGTGANPTIDGSHTTDGTGTGSFTSTITDLTAGTTYHVRAYATNSEGTAYGADVSFTTQNTTPVTPADGRPCPAPSREQIDTTINVFDTLLFNQSIIRYDANNSPYIYTYKGDTLQVQCGWIYKFKVQAGGIYEWNTDISHGVVSTVGNNLLRTKITLFYDDDSTYATVSQEAVHSIVPGCAAAGLAWKANYTGTVGIMVTRGDNGFDMAGDFCACNNDFLLLRYNQLAHPDNSNFIVWGRYGITDTLPCDDDIHYVYDSGLNAMRENASGNYSNNENGYLVLYPEDIRSKLKLWGACKLQDGDTLFIYNGDYSQDQNLIAFETITGQQELGNEENPIFMSQIAGNPISLRMKSDSSCTLTGFELSAKCCPVTVSLPTVTTSPVTDITGTSATSGGNVTADGGASVTARGVCWGTGANPTIGGSHTTDGTGTGSFTSTITGLTAGTTYHVRAYATNSAGTAYGAEVSFTTQNTTPVTPVDGQPCPGAATVTDHQGNVYHTVQIGSQCWTKENMRCTTSPTTGTTILDASPTSYSYTGKKAYYVDGNSSRTSTYGLLYNWNAAVDTFNTAYGETSTNTDYNKAVSVTFSGKRRGICPQGWHVPSDAEWTQLTTYVKSQQEYVCSGCSGTDDGNYTHCIAKALASATGWTSYTGTASGRDCYPGYAPSSNNAAGFSALPAGYFNGGSFSHVGDYAYFWSSKPRAIIDAYTRYFSYSNEYVARDYNDRYYGFSVRCLRDEAGGSTASIPTVTTSSATNITETAATCGGNVTADGGASVTARGVCWGTGANPTIGGSHTTDGTGTGSFTSTITGLTAGTTYHVRAYATNSAGTAYGAEVSFTTQNTTPVTPADGQPCPGAATVTDHQGNVYNTVQIGSQCWTKENMRCTTSPTTGTTILEASPTSYSYTGKKAYYVDGSSSNTSTYGLLYNWNAAVDTFNTAYGETSTNTDNNKAVSVTFSGKRRGICPQGWHVPSDAEWTQLTTYVKSQPDYVCSGCSGTDDGNYTHCIAKALASATGWNSYTGTASGRDCYPGYVPSSNNAAGFSALPAGDYTGSSFDIVGYRAYFWSSTPNGSSGAYYRYFYYDYEYVYRNIPIRGRGFSVRCLRDEAGGSTASLPTVTTSPVTDITETTAACGGNVTADGGADVTARGVCWSTGVNPTIGGSHTTDGTGTGSFTSTITGLTAGTTYHVRAYATNSEGTAYGEDVSFTTQNTTPVTPADGQPCPDAATVTDHQGNVYHTVQIGDQCWTKENMRCTTSPTTRTTILEESPTSYSYTGKKAYYVDGSSSNTSTYGLLYNWNAAVDTFNTAYGETSTNTDFNNAVNVAFSGKRRGICPQGWHVPSDAEWTQLTTYVKSQPDYVCSGCSGTDDDDYTHCIAKALASATGWNSYTGTACCLGYAPSSNNATGFSALPAGGFFGSIFSHVGYSANFWSSTPNGSHYAYSRGFDYGKESVNRYNNARGLGYSVRCLRDEAGGSAASLPTVTTSSATNITETSATSGGNVTADGGADVTARGVCWSTDANPTISGSHTTNGTGTGSFTSTITDLTAGTTYHVRAYATNSEGTAYGEDVSFTTQNTTPVTPADGQPCPGAATVTDHQGNVYHTVQIGSQCWTRENMRCTTSPSTGTTILEASPTSYSFTGKKAYYVGGSSSNTSAYGLLYNWNAAVDTFNTAYGETSTNTDYNKAVPVTFSGKRRGICPQGWHVPSDAEWTQLTTYVKSQPDYVCSGCSGTDDDYNTHCIAKALASATGWNSYTGTASGRDCYPGYAPSSNNAAGFSALPAGGYYGSSSYNVGGYAYFWSSTPFGSNGAYYRSLLYNSEYVTRYNYYYRYFGFSVRCLRD